MFFIFTTLNKNSGFFYYIYDIFFLGEEYGKIKNRAVY